VETPFDINENKHFDKHGNLFSDVEIFIKSSIKPDDVKLVKIKAETTSQKDRTSLAQPS
jgi:hypothetical protein